MAAAVRIVVTNTSDRPGDAVQRPYSEVVTVRKMIDAVVMVEVGVAEHDDFELAELLLEHYPDENPGAIEHVDFAIEEFRAMKMQPYLERALRHKGLLHA